MLEAPILSRHIPIDTDLSSAFLLLVPAPGSGDSSAHRRAFWSSFRARPRDGSTFLVGCFTDRTRWEGRHFLLRDGPTSTPFFRFLF